MLPLKSACRCPACVLIQSVKYISTQKQCSHEKVDDSQKASGMCKPLMFGPYSTPYNYNLSIKPLLNLTLDDDSTILGLN